MPYLSKLATLYAHGGIDTDTDDRAWARRLHVERKAHEWTDPDGAYCLSARMAPDAGARFSAAWKAHVDRIFCDARRAGRRLGVREALDSGMGSKQGKNSHSVLATRRRRPSRAKRRTRPAGALTRL